MWGKINVRGAWNTRLNGKWAEVLIYKYKVVLIVMLGVSLLDRAKTDL
jgi:hypothetical protein